jgi:hypothetical protein
MINFLAKRSYGEWEDIGGVEYPAEPEYLGSIEAALRNALDRANRAAAEMRPMLQARAMSGKTQLLEVDKRP